MPHVGERVGSRPREIVVATWNIRAAIGPGPFPSYWWDHVDRARLGHIAAFIATMDADVVALQEVGLMTVDGTPMDLPGDLGRLTGMDVRYAAVHTFPVVDGATGAVTGAGLWGNAILSRRPIRATTTVALPRGEDDELVERASSGRELSGVRYAAAPPGVREARCALVSEVDVDGERVSVVSTHLTYAGAGQRGRQAARLVDAAAGARSAVVVAGDLNAPIEAAELAAIRTAFVDTFTATGTPPGDPRRASCDGDRIDHILVRNLEPLSCRVATEAGDLSDHLPVIATLRLP
jgi:endonuclease/exonuclease/phosphatase family metal-dependent hydrolase